MKHSIEWQDDAENAVPEERATVGDLRLFVNHQNVTAHLLDGKPDDHVTVALYGMVDGLVHDWWRIFGMRDEVFSLRRYRAGFLLPDLQFRFDGAVFEIEARQSAYTTPDLRFWGGTSEVLSRSEGEQWLSNLITDVLDRLRQRGLVDTGAALRWRRVQSSRNSVERDFCEAAGSLGFDPYAIGEEEASFLERAEMVFNPEPLVEFASGAHDVDHGRLMDWVDRMTRFKGHRYRLANLRPVVDGLEDEVPNKTPNFAWARGYRRARAMRKALDLKIQDRIQSFNKLTTLLGAGKSYELAPTVDGINALRRERPDGTHVHVRNHGSSRMTGTMNLFALTRAIGDAACFPELETAPVNSLLKAYRQAAGRAFAAEFLAPIEEIDAMLSDERDQFSIADEFGVSTTLIAHQIDNRQRIAAAFT